ncbi:hypothetical protein PL8927_780185 [Planktothrix serta PCC 8927]|uniref:Uncharacterized protein n=1 Tax=Planktothrix serta PCC 8927 TaxID=671068 RepID=A0A7Z9BYK7_9CYAN|nr:hypothetical protein PL8927_780185 [Planktothrix serta PCC 8927]
MHLMIIFCILELATPSHIPSKIDYYVSSSVFCPSHSTPCYNF